MVKPNLMTQQYDIIIVGAGMVGASLAASLADTELSVLLIDKKITAFDDTINHRTLNVAFNINKSFRLT